MLEVQHLFGMEFKLKEVSRNLKIIMLLSAATAAHQRLPKCGPGLMSDWNTGQAALDQEAPAIIMIRY